GGGERCPERILRRSLSVRDLTGVRCADQEELALQPPQLRLPASIVIFRRDIDCIVDAGERLRHVAGSAMSIRQHREQVREVQLGAGAAKLLDRPRRAANALAIFAERDACPLSKHESEREPLYIVMRS